ncbi:MAG TPA: nuclear transport factor 2 family protein [Bryobacteraceae bacterium]
METTARAFVQAINRRNSEELAALMTGDHAFVDGLGVRLEGRERVKAAFDAYFRMVPDYTITVEETFSEGPVTVILEARKEPTRRMDLCLRRIVGAYRQRGA